MFTVADQPPSDHPLVSVSVLTYNAAAFVEEAVRSILRQEVTFPVEVIIGDDASADGTQDLLTEFAREHPHVIRLHLHDEHGAGVPGRVNNMHNLQSCRGEYIALLDGDDYWVADDKLARQVAFLRSHPGHSAVGGDGIILEGGRRSRALPPELRGADVDLASLGRRGVTGILPAGLMFRREWLFPLPPWFEEVLLADHYIVCLLLRRGPCRLLPGPLFAYRRHAGNFTATYLSSSARPFERYDDGLRHRRVFPELDSSILLDWRDLVALIHIARASTVRLDVTALKGVYSRLRREPLSRWLAAASFGVRGRVRRRLGGRS